MQKNITQVRSIWILTSGDDVAHGAEWGDDDDDKGGGYSYDYDDNYTSLLQMNRISKRI